MLGGMGGMGGRSYSHSIVIYLIEFSFDKFLEL